MNQSSVSVIVPAAGRSARFGPEDKLLMPWRGVTILQAVLDTAMELGPLEIILVSRLSDISLSLAGVRLEHEPTRVVQNLQPKGGMASSIAAGVLAASDRSAGFLIWPADMPLVPLGVVEEVVTRASEATCVRPSCHGEPGHPVLFGSDFRQALEEIGRGPGARHLLRDVDFVETEDRGVIEDIDTPATYERLVTAHA
ncbi:MAG: molybdenum cofactor cytidylyltransferase [Rhodothermales bacterium]|jgi:molybdenum cofactor cytidylyltransferase